MSEEANWYNPKVELMYRDFEDRKMQEFGDWSMQKEIVKQAMKCEDDVCWGVLKQFLSREPTTEDAKECQILMKSGVFDRYILCYKNQPLGSITKAFEGNIFKVLFTPGDTNI